MQRTIVITGASDGIGAAAARQLTAKGHRVVLVGRSPAKTAAVAQELDAIYHVADFADLCQVRELAGRLAQTCSTIDVLANNAGGIMGEREMTADGFEKTFQVNYLAPVLLTHLLLPVLIKSNASVVQTSSMAVRRYARLDLDDLQNKRAYSPTRAYGDAKLAVMLFTSELDRRYRAQGVAAASFHPGVVGTNFAAETTHPMRWLYHTPLLNRLFLMKPEKGADQLVWLAEQSGWQPGEYYEKRKPAESVAEARDPELARALWERTTDMLGVTTR